MRLYEPLLTDGMSEYLTLRQITEYLCNCTYEKANKQTFRPVVIAAALITNKAYDPEHHSKEIEESEWYFNHRSDEWKRNHSKMCCLSAVMMPFYMHADWYDEDGCRSFASPELIKNVTVWYNDLVQRGLHVYGISI